MLPRRAIALVFLLAACGAAPPPSSPTATNEPEAVVAMRWTGRIAEAEGFPWGEPGTPCDVEVARLAERVGAFDCRVRIRCGEGTPHQRGRVIYGSGDSGFNVCRWSGHLARAEDASASDGDPRMRMDLSAGEVEVASEDANAGAWRIVIANAERSGASAAELSSPRGSPERRVIVAPTNPPVVGVAVAVHERECSSCEYRPVAGATVELGGPTRRNGGVLASASGTTGENGVALVELPDGPDGLLWSPGPVVARVDGGEEMDVSHPFRLAIGSARRLATERAAQRPPDVGAWDGTLAGIAVAGRTRRQAARACAEAGLRWERYRESEYRCIGSDAPVPRHLMGHRGSMIVFTFDDEDRATSAALNVPFGSTQAAYRHIAPLVLEARRSIGQAEEEGGGPLSGRAIWRVRDTEGVLWRMAIANEGSTAVVGYLRAPADDSHPPATVDPAIEQLMTQAEE